MTSKTRKALETLRSARNGDGVIVWAETQELAALVQSLRVPAVNVCGSIKACRLPLIDTENRIVANLAQVFKTQMKIASGSEDQAPFKARLQFVAPFLH